AGKALQEFGLTTESIQKEVEKFVGRGTKQMQTIHYTPRAKKVVELSQDEARKLGHPYVGTEHILLGLIREGEGVAARVLLNLDVNLNKARQQVLQLLGTSESQGSQQSRGRSSTASTSTLDSLAKDLTASAREGKVDPVIGRDEEIDRIIQILSRRTKNNPVLIGDP